MAGLIIRSATPQGVTFADALKHESFMIQLDVRMQMAYDRSFDLIERQRIVRMHARISDEVTRSEWNA